MFMIINVVTKAVEGYFPSFVAAENWILSHGDRDNYRILPW